MMMKLLSILLLLLVPTAFAAAASSSTATMDRSQSNPAASSAVVEDSSTNAVFRASVAADANNENDRRGLATDLTQQCTTTCDHWLAGKGGGSVMYHPYLTELFGFCYTGCAWTLLVPFELFLGYLCGTCP
jgi:hypothetical protein